MFTPSIAIGEVLGELKGCNDKLVEDVKSAIKSKDRIKTAILLGQAFNEYDHEIGDSPSIDIIISFVKM